MSERTIRLAVVGAGAVTAARYLPAAATAEGVEVTHLVDLDLERARALAEEHGVPDVSDDHRQVLDAVDAAVVATPPASHRGITEDLLDAGVHVLCEKPLTVNAEEGEAMVAAVSRSGSILTVGMVRRYGRSARLLRRFVEMGVPGRIHRVDAEEGGGFTWPQRTSHIFEAGQGGVLRDTGTHLLDLVFWMADATDARVSSYRDDSWGGPEANARVDLEVETPSGAAEARVEVSFTRQLENRIRIHGTDGVLEAPTLGGAEVLFTPADGSDPVRLIPGAGRERSRVEDFVLQLEDFVEAIRSTGAPPVPAESALLPLRLIEHCHDMRAVSLLPWEAPPRAGDATSKLESRPVATGTYHG